MTDDNDLSLLPCPFCGGKAELWAAHSGRTSWIACMGKCAVLISKEYTTDAEAIDAWNTRAAPAVAASQPADAIINADSYQRVTVNEEQNTEQRKAFWNWLPLAYRDGHIGEEAKFTKYNMADAHYAGWQAAIDTQPDPRDAVIARLVEALSSAVGWTEKYKWAAPWADAAHAAIAAAKGGAA